MRRQGRDGYPGDIHSLAGDRRAARRPYSPASSRLLASFTSSLLCGFELVLATDQTFRQT